jgi:hypothetical protein
MPEARLFLFSKTEPARHVDAQSDAPDYGETKSFHARQKT